ncbi:MAG: NAD(P)/FAD-dependent oxidoreductase [Acidobacteriota bacterium]
MKTTHTPTASGPPGTASPAAPGLADYDVVVIGGAFSGSATATLLKRSRPEARVLVVESQESFPRKVGEATVEISGLFLHRILGLYDELSREHLPKHGLRFWFTDSPNRPLEEMSEVGPSRLPSLPSFQLDRSKLDETILGRAVQSGCDVLRPARVSSIEHEWPTSRIRIEGADGTEREVTARWVIDGSGRHQFIARRKRLRRRTEGHPTAALWGRWKGVQDLDGLASRGSEVRAPRLPELSCSRRLATNHFCGYGWWSWSIPLSGGETSIGLVYNKDLFDLPGDGSKGENYEAFLRSRAGLKELLASAELMEEDFHSFNHLPFRSEQYMGRGWALVGDAASFIDPYYSPGLDHAAISVYATVRLIEDDLAGRLDGDALSERIEAHNEKFELSYHRWLDALYRGKYELMGDAELTVAAFLMDTALYYMGVVTPIHKDLEALGNPMFGLPIPQSKIAYRILRGYSRRLVRLARFRRQVGLYGRRNARWRLAAKSPGLGTASLGMLRQGVGLWLKAELQYLGHRLRRGGVDLSEPVPRAVASPP